MRTKNGATLMDFYNAATQDQSLHKTDLLSWYRLPLDESQTELVVSVKASHAALFVIGYTYLVTLIFMACCELGLLIVLPHFDLGTSGTRHAMLVAYYNAGRPSKMILLMLGYLRNSLFRCRKVLGDHKIWAIDWSSAWASFSLFLIAFSLLSGNAITGFFLGGKQLIVANVAQVNPAAVYYPTFEHTDDGTGLNNVPREVFEAYTGLRSAAVHEALARQTSAYKNLGPRINYHANLIENGTLLENGTRQNGTGANFTYEYKITGYEMGLRDAPGLVFAVKGRCATYQGPDIVRLSANVSSPNITEQYESYRFYGDSKWPALVMLSREIYTAPWAELVMKRDDETLARNREYGGFTFEIVPHTAWRLSHVERLKDPWYETERSPAFRSGQTNDAYNAQYRVKSARPSLRCTQNDTYTHNGVTVNHVDKVNQLPGLKLSPMVRNFIFGREFGIPVFMQLLGYVPLGSLASTAHFFPKQRRLDAQRASLLTDFEELINTSFVYSREVVRNAVLLFPSLEGRNDQLLYNAANIGSKLSVRTASVLEENADFLIEGPAVAALSVFVLVATPAVCVFLWIIVFIWKTIYDPDSKLGNSGIKEQHGLRYYAFQAVHLYRYLDELLSKKRKFSGRMTATPFIRDLDDVETGEEETRFTASAKASEAQVTEATTSSMRKSEFAQPKLVRLDGVDPEPPTFMEIVVNWWKYTVLGRVVSPKVEYEVQMTQSWDGSITSVPQKNIRKHL